MRKVTEQIAKEKALLAFWEGVLEDILCGGIVEVEMGPELSGTGIYVPETYTMIWQGHHAPKVRDQIRQVKSGLKVLEANLAVQQERAGKLLDNLVADIQANSTLGNPRGRF